MSIGRKESRCAVFRCWNTHSVVKGNIYWSAPRDKSQEHWGNDMRHKRIHSRLPLIWYTRTPYTNLQRKNPEVVAWVSERSGSKAMQGTTGCWKSRCHLVRCLHLCTQLLKPIKWNAWDRLILFCVHFILVKIELIVLRGSLAQFM